jgi:hypothetical protein
MTTSGFRALAERRAGRSTLSGSIAARGLRGTRVDSALLCLADIAASPGLAARWPLGELPVGYAANPRGGLTSVTAARPVPRFA